MFCVKLQNICPVAANPDQMDKNGYNIWTQHPPKPLNPLQTSSTQKSCVPVLSFIGDYFYPLQLLQCQKLLVINNM